MELAQYNANKAAAAATAAAAMASYGLAPRAGMGSPGYVGREPNAPAMPVSAYTFWEVRAAALASDDSDLQLYPNRPHTTPKPTPNRPPTATPTPKQSDYRQGLPANLPPHELSALCMQGWRDADPEVKAPYQQLARRDLERYAAAMAVYSAQLAAQHDPQLAAALDVAMAGGPISDDLAAHLTQQQQMLLSQPGFGYGEDGANGMEWQAGGGEQQDAGQQLGGDGQGQAPAGGGGAAEGQSPEQAQHVARGQLLQQQLQLQQQAAAAAADNLPRTPPRPTAGTLSLPLLGGGAGNMMFVNPSSILSGEWAIVPRNSIGTAMAPIPAAASGHRGLSSADVQATLETGLDMRAARTALARIYTAEAFELLLDAWRSDSSKARDAVRSFKAHIAGEGGHGLPVSLGWWCCGGCG